MTQHRLAIAGLALVLCAGSARSAGEADAFSLTGVGARSGGMGNANIGLADDIESVYYNPAGLGNLINSGGTAMYQTPSLDTSRSFLAANKRWVHPQFPGSVAFGWLRLRSADIELTSTDERILGADSLTNDLFILAAGVRPFPHWSVGLSMKYYRYAFNGFSQGGLGYDVGVHGQYNPFRFGFTFTDIGGTRLSGDSIESAAPEAIDVVPARWRPGVGLVFPEPFGWPLHVSWDLDALVKLQGAQDAKIFTGAEVWAFRSRAALRSGYQQGAGPTFGFGARFGLLQLDYSYLMSLYLKDEHRISTTVRL
jgi:hypothetical protein